MSSYPDFVQTCGLGSVTGIGGANCRHSYWPFIEGVMERTYTDEELKNIDPPPFEFEGKTYTMYEATQKQRMIERTIRKLKRERAAYRAAGLSEEAQAVSVRIRRLDGEYQAFSKAAGLPQQRERMNVLYMDSPRLQNAAGRNIIEVKHTSTTAGPGTITQRTNAKGGIDRNYYGPDGRQTVQISNNGHGHKKEEAIGFHGEHAHDYIWDESGLKRRGDARELTPEERRENSDFLKTIG